MSNRVQDGVQVIRLNRADRRTRSGDMCDAVGGVDAGEKNATSPRTCSWARAALQRGNDISDFMRRCARSQGVAPRRCSSASAQVTGR
jgi:hypothetical protein